MGPHKVTRKLRHAREAVPMHARRRSDQGKAVVTQEDFAVADPKGPIREYDKVDCLSLTTLYETDFKDCKPSGADIAARVYRIAADVFDMHFKPEVDVEPFGLIFTLTKGRRSAIPSDLRRDQCGAVAAIATDIANPELRLLECLDNDPESRAFIIAFPSEGRT